MKIDFNNYKVKGESEKKDYNEMFKSLVTLVSPVYDADKGHGWKHINEVFKRCLKIGETVKDSKLNEVDFKTYIIATLLHDVYSSTDRNNHHILARDLVARLVTIYYGKVEGRDIEKDEKNTMSSIPKQDGSKWNNNSFDFLYHVNIRILDRVMDCVLNHRSSGDSSYDTVIGEVFAAADNDPLDIVKIIGRIDTCSQDDKDYVVPDLSEEDRKLLLYHKQDIRTYLHLRDKFSRNGYMFNNMKEDGIFMTYYKDEIEKFWNEVDEVLQEPGLISGYVREYKNIKGDRYVERT